MIAENYRRILIFGQPFNNYSGGGITISTLFLGWPLDKIATAAAAHLFRQASDDICINNYHLGYDNHRWLFPFNYLQRHYPSGLIQPEKFVESGSVKTSHDFRKILVDRILYPVLNWSGLVHIVSRICFSADLKKWLSAYKPEILYLQVSTREEIRASLEICDYINVPVVIHMMDDWPSSIVGKRGIFKRYWKKKIDREFRELLERCTLFFSISKAMSAEYAIRYRKDFIPFHNSVDISKFRRINTGKEKTGIFRILYLGRIGIANKNSIYFFARAISGLQSDRIRVQFNIYTRDNQLKVSKAINKLDGVEVRPAVPHSTVPDLLSESDLLLLPLDFTNTAIEFARYSLPTKASEYMASGTPMLVFAPGTMAITEFCQENECGLCITEQNREKLCAAVRSLEYDTQLRKKLSSNAIKIASELFDVNIVREKFQKLLLTSTKT